MDDLISRQAAIEAFDGAKFCEVNFGYEDGYNEGIDFAVSMLSVLPSARPEIKPIEYRACANAMLRMWMDNVVNDGEYNRIMAKLNVHWGKDEDEIN